MRDNLDGTTTGFWGVNITAQNEQGNAMVDYITPENEPIAILIGALDYYLKNNKMQSLPDHLFKKK